MAAQRTRFRRHGPHAYDRRHDDRRAAAGSCREQTRRQAPAAVIANDVALLTPPSPNAAQHHYTSSRCVSDVACENGLYTSLRRCGLRRPGAQPGRFPRHSVAAAADSANGPSTRHPARADMEGPTPKCHVAATPRSATICRRQASPPLHTNAATNGVFSIPASLPRRDPTTTHISAAPSHSSGPRTP